MLAQRTLFCLKLLTTPSAPLRNRIFLLRRSHPSLKRRGMGPQPHLNSSPSAETYKVVAGFRPYASFSLDSSVFKEGNELACLRHHQKSDPYAQHIRSFPKVWTGLIPDQFSIF